jgi:predicted nucleic acid-binding protein
VRQAVVDASVAVKWVVEEDHSAEAAILLEFDACHAPDHWRAEAVNVLWSKVFRGDLTAADAEERMTVLLRAPVIGAPIADLMARAFAISVARTVTIYDSLYVALAERRDIVMVTADERLIRRLSGDAALAKRMVWVGDLVA